MSRVGKYPVAIPSGVTITLAGGRFEAKGKLGVDSLSVSDNIDVTVEDNKVWVKPRNEGKEARMMWGTTRANINNMLKGVSDGFTVTMDINGVGYRASVQGNVLLLQLGYSHDINFPIPADIAIKCEKPTAIAVSGFNRQRVGQVASEIRSLRPPEPYKGKGIKYTTETILRKEGKKK
jgi:large subunit ribosomal protein L6